MHVRNFQVENLHVSLERNAAGLPIVLGELGLEADVSPHAEHLAPIACLRGGRKVLVAEHGDVVIGDALGLIGVVKVVLHLLAEVREVIFDRHVVRRRALRDEELVVWLNPAQFRNYGHTVAVLEILQATGVRAAWRVC